MTSSSSQIPVPSRLPKARRWGTGAKLLLALTAVVVIGGVGTGAWIAFRGKGQVRNDLLPHRVGYEDLQVTIVERGALESAENRDIICRVKAGTKNSTIATTIKWVIDNGTEVQTGDKVIELDDSGLQEQLKTQKINVDQARADWVQAEEAYKIQESQNASDIATAMLTLDQAKIVLQKYLEGEYQQTRRDIIGRLEMAKSDLEMWEERAAWSERMSRPGRRYVTQAQADSDRARTISARIAREKVEEELRVLDDPTYGLRLYNLKDLQGKIDEAQRALDRTRQQAKAKLVQAEATRKAKLSVFEQQAKAYDDIEDEIRKCVIAAPNAGLVVYFVPEQSRFGSGSQQSIIAQGEPVREGQKLMRIPDLSKMVVNTKVHEAVISKVRGDLWQKTGFSDCVQLGVSLVPDLFARLGGQAVFQDDRTEFSERYKQIEQRLVRDGQKALVKVDSFAGKALPGHVRTVATVASQQDWLSADVKVYQTYVAIDEPLDGLRPDMSAEVTIYTDQRKQHVLTVPLQSVFGSRERGHKVFVKTEEGPAEREVVLGLSNDKVIEVKSGLSEGEDVVLNPRTLIPEKDRQAPGLPGAWPGGEKKGPGGDKKGDGKGSPGGDKKGPWTKGPAGPKADGQGAQ